MQPTLKHLSAACAGALLLACADVGRLPAPAVVPSQAAGAADDAYAAGRQQHLAGRRALATATYQAALRADPRHINARNGLATLFAEQGEYAKAIRLWQELTAGADAPGPASAYLYANLGFAYFLSADYPRALVTLERACILDPLNALAWRHLGDTLGKLGQGTRAQLMYKQASALEAHDFKADYTLARRSGVAAIDGAVAAAPADGMAQSELRQGADGMFELHRVSPPVGAAAPAPAVASAVAAAPAEPADSAESAPEPLPAARTFPVEAAAPPEPAPADTARFEIRNGNGVTGMARRLARRLGDAGVRVTRLSNQKGFNVAHSRIEYQPGFRDAALRLAERFGDAPLIEVAAGESSDVRLVIGRDLMRSKFEARRLIRAALARAATRPPQ